MASGQPDVMLPSYRTLFGIGAVGGMSDSQLLSRFVRGDEVGQAAFAALVARHGPMVLGVCRSLLGDPHDADDAFQAVFLVLARKARTIRDPELLGNWLYAVAQHTARKARARRFGRESREQAIMGRASETAQESPGQLNTGMIDREDAEALHEEVGRLPGSLRAPIVLCYIEGMTHDEAALRLKCPVGTIRSRMAKARELLRGRLVRRGFVASALVLTADSLPRGVLASVPASLAEQTTRAAASAVAHTTAAGWVSTSVLRLADEVLATMFWSHLAMSTSAIVALVMCASGVGLVLAQRSDSKKPQPEMKAEAPAVPLDRAKSHSKAEARAIPVRGVDAAHEKTMTVTGRVLDPEGRPREGVSVGFYTFPTTGLRRAGEGARTELIVVPVTTDREGRFQLITSRTASITHHRVCVLAGSEGFGMGWQALDPDAEKPDIEIRLRPERLVRARLIDLQGQGASGVKVVVQRVAALVDGVRDGIAFFDASPSSLPWSSAATTDAQGWFTLRGIGQGEGVEVQVRDDRFARQDLHIEAEDGNPAQKRTFVLNAAHIIEGRVTYADTGKPAAHARLVVQGGRYISGEADADGRFRLNPFADNPERTETGEKIFTVFAHPGDGEPYMSLSKDLPWQPGAPRQTLDFVLPRGVLLRGTIKDATSGKPLEGVQVQYEPLPNVSFDRREYVVTGSWSPAITGREGTFAIGVLPRKGHLVVLGPTAEYLLNEYGSQLISSGRPGGLRKYAQAVVPIDAEGKKEPVEVSISLKKGVTLEGRVLDPEGKPVERGTLETCFNVGVQAFRWGGNRVPVTRGRFFLPGLDSDRVYPLVVIDSNRRWGAAVELPAKGNLKKPLTIQLAPCGAVRARVLDEAGKPVANYQLGLQIVLTKGRYQSDFDGNVRDESLAADAGAPYLNGMWYQGEPATDAEGRITLPGLIPGATYRLLTTDRGQISIDSSVLKDFSVGTAETRDLGDFTIKGAQVDN